MTEQRSQNKETQTAMAHLCHKAPFQVLEEVSEEVGVGVLAELVENKPVTNVAVCENTSASGQVRGSETSVAEENKMHLKRFILEST